MHLVKIQTFCFYFSVFIQTFCFYFTTKIKTLLFMHPVAQINTKGVTSVCFTTDTLFQHRMSIQGVGKINVCCI